MKKQRWFACKTNDDDDDDGDDNSYFVVSIHDEKVWSLLLKSTNKKEKYTLQARWSWKTGKRILLYTFIKGSTQRKICQ